mgnify:CR=1 FL=1
MRLCGFFPARYLLPLYPGDVAVHIVLAVVLGGTVNNCRQTAKAFSLPRLAK